MYIDLHLNIKVNMYWRIFAGDIPLPFLTFEDFRIEET